MKPLITSLLFLCLAATVVGQVSDQPLSDVNEIMYRVFLHDSQRESQSGGYAGHRRYIFENEKMHKHAELVVDVLCETNGTKHFNVITEDGWKAANKHVLKKMLESESETSSPDIRPQTRLTADNYSFSLVNTEMVNDRLTYVVDVTPKRRDKYLMEGRVWIDAQDFAMVRAEGKPAHNPSFWTKSIHFVQQYRKSGSYWFPVSTLSVTDARFFGTTKVNINYFDYQPNSGSDVAKHTSTVHFQEVSNVTN